MGAAEPGEEVPFMSKFLNELEAKNLLAEYGVPMAKSFLAVEENEAAELAKRLEFPVVMKVLSADIPHKTEAGCVFVGVKDEGEARETFRRILQNAETYDPQAKLDGVLIQEMAPEGLEVIVGMKKDPQFGPVVMAGTGGIYVEVFRDIALRLLPISRKDAKAMIAETKLGAIIKGARGTKYDEEALIDALLRVSEAVAADPSIQEIDINPLFLYEQGRGAKGVDALIKMV